MLKKSLLSLVVVGVLMIPRHVYAEGAVPPPQSVAVAETPAVKTVPLTVDDLMNLFHIQAWKWQMPLPAGTKNLLIYREEWRKGAKEPRLQIINNMSGVFSQAKLHEVMVRWQNSRMKDIACSIDGVTMSSMTTEDEPFIAMGYALRIPQNQDTSTAKLNEPLTLVMADYRRDGMYGVDAFKPGPNTGSDRILCVKMYVSDKSVSSVRWENDRAVFR